MTLNLHIENPTPERYLQFLRFTLRPDTREVVSFFHFLKPTRATALKKLESVQEQLSQTHEVKFRLFCHFPKGQLYPPALLRRLLAMGVTAILPAPRPRLELRLQRNGIRTGLQTAAPRYTEETAAGFSHWLHDPAATPEPAYMNLLSAVTLGIASPDCRRSSCLTRYFYLDREGELYLCPHERSDRTRLGRPEDAPDALTLFSGAVPLKLLETAVTRRAACEGCESFGLCRGGCPLADAQCESYRQTLSAVRKALTELKTPEGLNPHATRLLLHALAFRPDRDP